MQPVNKFSKNHTKSIPYVNYSETFGSWAIEFQINILDTRKLPFMSTYN